MPRVSVTVDDEHVDRIDEVAAALRAAGLDVTDVLGATGVITGTVADDRRDALADLNGVESVADDVDYRLPPPDAPVQ